MKASHTTDHTYATRVDGRGRLLSIFHSQFSILNLAAGHAYDPGNRPNKHTFADGEFQEWEYDKRNFVTNSTYDDKPIFTQSYDDAGRLTDQVFGNGLTREIDYNNQDNLRTNDTVAGVGVPLGYSSPEANLQMSYIYFNDKQIEEENFPNNASLWWGDHEKTRRLVGFLDRSAATWPTGPKPREAGLSQCSEHSRSEAETDRSETTCPQGGAAINHQAGQATIQNDLWAHPTALNTIIARAVDGSKFKMEWYHKNYLDHVYAVSDDTGDILEHYRYTAFGQVETYSPTGNQLAASAIDNPVRWNSRRYDEATQLLYYKYRNYIPKLGRWPSRDPIGEEGGVNLYAFVGNDSLSRWDMLGLTNPFNDLEVITEDELINTDVDYTEDSSIVDGDFNSEYEFLNGKHHTYFHFTYNEKGEKFGCMRFEHDEISVGQVKYFEQWVTLRATSLTAEGTLQILNPNLTVPVAGAGYLGVKYGAPMVSAVAKKAGVIGAALSTAQLLAHNRLANIKENYKNRSFKFHNTRREIMDDKTYHVNLRRFPVHMSMCESSYVGQDLGGILGFNYSNNAENPGLSLEDLMKLIPEN